MEILSQRAFDIFRFIFPGLFVTAIFVIIKSGTIKTPDDIITVIVDKIAFNRVILLILGSYVIGIAHDQFCAFLLRIFKLKKSFKQEYISPSSLSTAEKYVLVRHFSPKIIVEIDKWHMLKGMCVNISGFLLYFTFCCIVKFSAGNPFWSWFMLSIFSLSGSILIYIRSKSYNTWALQDLDSAIDTLNLIEKGKSWNPNA
ncbi:hypothetical protein [Pedobacter sp.]|uniref:hypothetical protein n=1 Tax=Pedobacter sp. TaxID=1411316 RepID=UPI003C4E4B4F